MSVQFQIMAVDQGSPRKSATATLVVNIRDVNNKNPYFDPTQVRREVREGELSFFLIPFSKVLV